MEFSSFLSPYPRSIVGYLCSFTGFSHFIVRTHNDSWQFSVKNQGFGYNQAVRFSRSYSVLHTLAFFADKGVSMLKVASSLFLNIPTIQLAVLSTERLTSNRILTECKTVIIIGNIQYTLKIIPISTCHNCHIPVKPH